MPSYSHSDTYPSLSAFVASIRAGDNEATAELYRRISSDWYYYILRAAGTDTNEIVTEVFLTVWVAVMNNRLREPAKITGYIRSTIDNTCSELYKRRARARRREHPLECARKLEHNSDPLADCERAEAKSIAVKLMHTLHALDAEILLRFYVGEESPLEIMRALNLTPTQFRLRKSRAKKKIIETAAVFRVRAEAA